jgi:hypothetical protein
LIAIKRLLIANRAIRHRVCPAQISPHYLAPASKRGARLKVVALAITHRRTRPSHYPSRLPRQEIVNRVQTRVECGSRGCSSMVEQKLPKLTTRVRFPSPAPVKSRACIAFRFNAWPQCPGAASVCYINRPGFSLPPESPSALFNNSNVRAYVTAGLGQSRSGHL